MKRLEIAEIRRKRVRAMEKELQRLFIAKRNQGFQMLEKPIKDGWFKHLALREDVTRRKDAQVFQEIIDRCGLEIWGSDKRQADKNWNRFHSRNNENGIPGLELLYGEKLVGISKKARMYFDGYDWQWMSYSGYVKRYFCKAPRHFFVTKYSKSYITKVNIIDPELNRRIDELESEFNENGLYQLRMSLPFHQRWKPYNYHGRKRKRVKDQLKKYDEMDFDYWSNKSVDY